ncbi:MAG: Bug family tripartite tricarboxylate transporter substrate binding protein [Paracraurococcus sp.]
MLPRRLALAGLAGVVGAQSARATSFPQRLVRILVPVPAGSVPDILARLIAERAASEWGFPVVVENRPGAGGAIGVEAGVRSPSDGHTLLLGSSGPIAILPAVNRRLSYHPLRDLLPIARVADFPLVVLASRDSGLRSFAEFLARARSTADTLDYAGGDIGSTQHLAGALLAVRAGLRLNHVPYRGGGLAQADLIAGRIPVMVDSLSAVLRTIQDAKATPLAVCGLRRSAQLSEVPTVQEAGVPDYEATGWMGLFVPAATPFDIVAALTAALMPVLTEPALASRVAAIGSDATVQDGLVFTRFVADELTKWKRLAEVAGIMLD